MLLHKKISALLTASLAMIASAAILAQETDQSDDSSDEIEEVVGVRNRLVVHGDDEVGVDVVRHSALDRETESGGLMQLPGVATHVE